MPWAGVLPIGDYRKKSTTSRRRATYLMVQFEILQLSEECCPELEPKQRSQLRFIVSVRHCLLAACVLHLGDTAAGPPYKSMHHGRASVVALAVILCPPSHLLTGSSCGAPTPCRSSCPACPFSTSPSRSAVSGPLTTSPSRSALSAWMVVVPHSNQLRCHPSYRTSDRLLDMSVLNRRWRPTTGRPM